MSTSLAHILTVYITTGADHRKQAVSFKQ